MNKDKKNIAFWIILILFFLNTLAWAVVYDLNKNQFLEVNFFDVGQGDAILIETPKGYQILIDGGPTNTILEKLGQEMPFWDRTIDVVILTHPEHDHIAGLLEVLERYKVDYILWTGVLRDTAEYDEWKRLLTEENANIKIAQAGQKIITPKSVINILYPFENIEGKEVSNTNNTSVITHLVFGNTTFLFTGDAYKSVERKLVNGGVIVESDVLKVGHHGSKTSTSRELLEQVMPEIAVISVGRENRYGHPYNEVLELLAEYGIKVLRTDQAGDIKIISDGENLKYEVSNFQN